MIREINLIKANGFQSFTLFAPAAVQSHFHNIIVKGSKVRNLFTYGSISFSNDPMSNTVVTRKQIIFDGFFSLINTMKKEKPIKCSVRRIILINCDFKIKLFSLALLLSNEYCLP